MPRFTWRGLCAWFWCARSRKTCYSCVTYPRFIDLILNLREVFKPITNGFAGASAWSGTQLAVFLDQGLSCIPTSLKLGDLLCSCYSEATVMGMWKNERRLLTYGHGATVWPKSDRTNSSLEGLSFEVDKILPRSNFSGSEKKTCTCYDSSHTNFPVNGYINSSRSQ